MAVRNQRDLHERNARVRSLINRRALWITMARVREGPPAQPAFAARIDMVTPESMKMIEYLEGGAGLSAGRREAMSL